jgi:deoxyribodipyrimidine photolyase-related protein
MGDHCKGCAYNKKERTGPKACPFNALYWDFFERHQDRLAGNHRLSMVYKQLEKMGAEARGAIAQQAALTTSKLDQL